MLIRSYTESVYKLHPSKASPKPKRLTIRKKTVAERINLDAFDSSKQIFDFYESLRDKTALSKTEKKEDYQRPVYIGQMLYIRPSYIVSLPEFSSSRSYDSEAFNANKKNLKVNSHGGLISNKADKKLRNAINWLICAAEPKKVFVKKTNSWFNFKVNFITLTLPDTDKKITDYEFKTKLLNPYLTYLRKYHKLKNYVWKLEFQKNGKLHLHITTDTFLHHARVRKIWNKLLLSNGYLVAFAKKFNHLNPNSTDIHSVRKIKDLGAYMAKYMCKPDARLKEIKGRIWGCNFEISQANKTSLYLDNSACLTELRPLMSPKIDWHKMQRVDNKTGLLSDNGEIFYLKFTDWLVNIKGEIKKTFDNVLLGLKNIAHSGSLFPEINMV